MNLTREFLTQEALRFNEGQLNDQDVFCALTGKRTGRSPGDRYIVDNPSVQQNIDWGKVNQAYDSKKFETLWTLTQGHLKKRHYHSTLFAGQDPNYQTRLSVTTEFAWHHIFAMNLFIEKEDTQPDMLTWEILNAPTLTIDPSIYETQSESAVMIDLVTRRILIIGMRYAGEMKKAVFSALNYWLPTHDVLPMHCAANEGEDGKVALFFGLSGTGKTTLSSDLTRTFIGDDEHGWSPSGVFNIEGGCYAKCVDLNAKKEPVIWSAIRSGSIMENVFLDAEKKPQFANTSITENSRMAYPLNFIKNRVSNAMGQTPSHVIFLTCDLFGVLPPVSVLSANQSAFYFLMGYTAKVGSTEMNALANIAPVFSACFGAPFFPRPAADYASLLTKRLQTSGAKVFLVNTGWHCGPYGHGSRYDIDFTRKIIHAICHDQIDKNKLSTLPGFNLLFPTQITGINGALLDPRDTWTDRESYNENAEMLINQFIEHSLNIPMPTEIRQSCPQSIIQFTS
ncbi:phosphoenolpyruvate carboxykinase (ATP) [Gammaproteobacteria bacterium]|nr:phosphoenolpyruvate carboxykinase (ATP) [Gammaproteobacteria bacterium]